MKGFLLVLSSRGSCTFRKAPQPRRALNHMTAVASSNMSVLEESAMAGDAMVWAAQNGLVMGYSGVQKEGQVQGSGIQVVMAHAPVSIIPTKLPKDQFENAADLGPDFNDLMLAVSSDKAFLRRVVAKAALYDTFTAQLVQLMDRVDASQSLRPDPVSVMINRSDYMLDEPSGRMLQVEINMIAASFAGLSTKVSSMHRFLLSKYTVPGVSPGSLPANDALDGLAEALGIAAKAYRDVKRSRGGRGRPLMLMVVQPGERNAFDQQWMSTRLWEQHGVDTMRRTLAEVEEQGVVAEDGTLTVDGKDVAVVYLRAGYSPDDYPTQQEWEGRFKLEISDAPKCPTVAMQIAGAKRVQQELALPGVTERFVGEDRGAKLRTVYAGQWSFEDSDSKEVGAIKEEAMRDPGSFVLKPQREGGGNNIYGDKIVDTLRNGGDDLAQYILMERIKPKKNRTLFLRNGEFSWAESLSELGVYGVAVRKGEEILMNKTAGYLLRTKLASSDEGGVAAGFAVLDSASLE